MSSWLHRRRPAADFLPTWTGTCTHAHKCPALLRLCRTVAVHFVLTVRDLPAPTADASAATTTLCMSQTVSGGQLASVCVYVRASAPGGCRLPTQCKHVSVCVCNKRTAFLHRTRDTRCSVRVAKVGFIAFTPRKQIGRACEAMCGIAVEGCNRQL